MFCQNCSIWTKEVVFAQLGPIWRKLVVFEQKWFLLSSKVPCFAKMVVFGSKRFYLHILATGCISIKVVPIFRLQCCVLPKW